MMKEADLYTKYLTEIEVSKMTGFSRSKLRHDRMLNSGIPYIKTRRSVRYKYEDVVKYMESRKVMTNDN